MTKYPLLVEFDPTVAVEICANARALGDRLAQSSAGVPRAPSLEQEPINRYSFETLDRVARATIARLTQGVTQWNATRRR